MDQIFGKVLSGELKLNFFGLAGGSRTWKGAFAIQSKTIRQVETEKSEAPSYSNILQHNGGATRGESAGRIFQKYFHKIEDISRLRGQILMKSCPDG